MARRDVPLANRRAGNRVALELADLLDARLVQQLVPLGLGSRDLNVREADESVGAKHAEQGGQPERRIGGIMKSEILCRRRVTLVIIPSIRNACGI
jgi:hypothetical protein